MVAIEAINPNNNNNNRTNLNKNWTNPATLLLNVLCARMYRLFLHVLCCECMNILNVLFLFSPTRSPYLYFFALTRYYATDKRDAKREIRCKPFYENRIATDWFSFWWFSKQTHYRICKTDCWLFFLPFFLLPERLFCCFFRPAANDFQLKMESRRFQSAWIGVCLCIACYSRSSFDFIFWLATVQRTYWSVNYIFCLCSFAYFNRICECVYCVCSPFRRIYIRSELVILKSHWIGIPCKQCILLHNEWCHLFEFRTKSIVWPFFCSIGRYIHWLNKYKPNFERWRFHQKNTT